MGFKFVSLLGAQKGLLQTKICTSISCPHQVQGIALGCVLGQTRMLATGGSSSAAGAESRSGWNRRWSQPYCNSGHCHLPTPPGLQPGLGKPPPQATFVGPVFPAVQSGAMLHAECGCTHWPLAVPSGKSLTWPGRFTIFTPVSWSSRTGMKCAPSA